MTTKQPTSYGLHLDDAKAYLRVEHSLEDSLISSIVTASYQMVCNYCNRDFVETTNAVTLHSASYAFLATQNVTNLSTGSLVVKPTGNYVMFGDPFSGQVTYTTGISGSSVPNAVSVAQLMNVASLYDHRDTIVVGASVAKLDFTMACLLDPYVLTNATL